MLTFLSVTNTFQKTELIFASEELSQSQKLTIFNTNKEGSINLDMKTIFCWRQNPELDEAL